MAAVTVGGLVKRYGATTALDGVSFDVGAGEVYAVLGPNGAGKTTCLEILEGYRRADAGTVRVLGVDPAHAGPGWRDRIGVLLQATTVEPQLTVAEALRMYAALYLRARSVEELLDVVDLHAERNRRAGDLSGGQQRRLDLALALVGRPELVFLDEPTTGFDPRARRRTWGVIRSLASDGVTVLLTTHYLEEAAALADRVAVIARGRLLVEGDPATLGGQDLDLVTVRFRVPDGLTLPAEVARHVRAGVATVETHAPTALLATVGGAAARQGVELPGLTVSRPTLEDVYLDLTGEHTDG